MPELPFSVAASRVRDELELTVGLVVFALMSIGVGIWISCSPPGPSDRGMGVFLIVAGVGGAWYLTERGALFQSLVVEEWGVRWRRSMRERGQVTWPEIERTDCVEHEVGRNGGGAYTVCDPRLILKDGRIIDTVPSCNRFRYWTPSEIADFEAAVASKISDLTD